MSYYIKRLKSQELGSGTVARGRYFYISKSVLAFFPPLSQTITNDMALLSVINVSLDPTTSIYCSFVYHNDKHTKPDGTRDEYRMYLNTEIDPDRAYFQENDIVVFEKVANQAHTYLLYRFDNTDSIYNELERLIDESTIRGGHALVEDIEGLEEIEVTIEAEEQISVISDEVNTRVVNLFAENEQLFDAEEMEQGAHLFTADSFRNFVLNSYGKVCAITGDVIEWNSYNNLEAAHIKPRAHHGPFLPCNGICMSKDFHWAFDKGFFTINDDFTIKVHPDIRDTALNEYDGQSIQVPEGDFFKPCPKYLKYHRDEIYGLFLRSGQIRRLS